MKEVVIKSLPILRLDDFPSYAGSISVYKNIIVCWDDDYDGRIVEFLDTLDNLTRSCILAIGEHKGSIFFLWKEGVCIHAFDDGVSTTEEIGSDWWYPFHYQMADGKVQESKVCYACGKERK